MNRQELIDEGSKLLTGVKLTEAERSIINDLYMLLSDTNNVSLRTAWFAAESFINNYEFTSQSPAYKFSMEIRASYNDSEYAKKRQ